MAHHETESRAYDIKDTAAARIYNNTKRQANDVRKRIRDRDADEVVNGKVGYNDRYSDDY